MSETRSVFKTDVSAVIYSNTQRLIKGDTVRDKFLVMADSVLFFDSDKNVNGGYLGIDSLNGNVDISFIKATSPTGKFLKDDGSWANPWPSLTSGLFLTNNGSSVSWGSPFPDQTTNSGKALTTNGSFVSWTTIIPSQTGLGGKFLTTNGSITSWGSPFPDQTTNGGKALTTDGSSVSWTALIPSQTGLGGKFLTTNGSVTSWGSPLPDQSTASGKFLTSNGSLASWASPFPDQGSNNGKVLMTNGSAVSWNMLVAVQTSNGGKFLTTNGSATSWASVLPDMTSNGGKVLLTDGTNASWNMLVASQTGNGGKFLTTNGSVTSWATIPAAGSDGCIQFATSGALNSSSRFMFQPTSNFLKVYGSATFGLDPSNDPGAYIDIAPVTAGIGIASLRIRPSSGTAPGTPNDGDIWYNGTNLMMRIGGSNKKFTLAP